MAFVRIRLAGNLPTLQAFTWMGTHRDLPRRGYGRHLYLRLHRPDGRCVETAPGPIAIIFAGPQDLYLHARRVTRRHLEAEVRQRRPRPAEHCRAHDS